MKAPEFIIERWLNTDSPKSLESLHGKVVMVSAFQMLCPGCVELCIPQAKKVNEFFPANDLVVLGLHTVFEHHEAMQEVSLNAFMHEYRISFPVGIDMPSDNQDTPQTMATYAMRGTPTTLLIDRNGQLRKQHFGHIPDLVLGAEIMSLINEKEAQQTLQNTGTLEDNNVQKCDLQGNCT